MDSGDVDQQERLVAAAERSADALETIRTLLIVLAFFGLLMVGAAVRYLAG